MTYATQQQLIDRFGQQNLVNLTDRAVVATGSIDGAVIVQALTDADALIDGSLSVRYNLPLVTVPPLVVNLAQVIAYWNLHITEPDAKTRTDYEDARRTLRDIADGRVRIPAAGLEPVTAGSGGVMVTVRERPFTEATMTGFI